MSKVLVEADYGGVHGSCPLSAFSPESSQDFSLRRETVSGSMKTVAVRGRDSRLRLRPSPCTLLFRDNLACARSSFYTTFLFQRLTPHPASRAKRMEPPSASFYARSPSTRHPSEEGESSAAKRRKSSTVAVDAPVVIHGARNNDPMTDLTDGQNQPQSPSTAFSSHRSTISHLTTSPPQPSSSSHTLPFSQSQLIPRDPTQERPYISPERQSCSRWSISQHSLKPDSTQSVTPSVSLSQVLQRPPNLPSGMIVSRNLPAPVPIRAADVRQGSDSPTAFYRGLPHLGTAHRTGANAWPPHASGSDSAGYRNRGGGHLSHAEAAVDARPSVVGYRSFPASPSSTSLVDVEREGTANTLTESSYACLSRREMTSDLSFTSDPNAPNSSIDSRSEASSLVKSTNSKLNDNSRPKTYRSGRRRQFKYLSDPTTLAGSYGKPSPGPGQGYSVPKKVKRACIFCKRSHMPCEAARPCQRCVKRKIAHLCKDEHPAGTAPAWSQFPSEERNIGTQSRGLTLPAIPTDKASPRASRVPSSVVRNPQFRAFSGSTPSLQSQASILPLSIPRSASGPYIGSSGFSSDRHTPNSLAPLPVSFITRRPMAALDFLHLGMKQSEQILFAASEDADYICRMLSSNVASLVESTLNEISFSQYVVKPLPMMVRLEI